MKNICVYHFKNGSWCELKGVESEAPSIKDFTLLTFNVMFDERGGKMYKEHIVHSKERFLFQIREFERMDVDFLCLNEVTKNYVEMLKENEFIRNNYILSNASGFGSYFGNVFLSKVAPTRVISCTFRDKISRCRRKPIIFQFGDNSLAICSAHLTAKPSSTEERKAEFEYLYKVLHSEVKCKYSIICGDMNFRSEEEGDNATSNSPDVSDLWLTVHEDFKNGVTFDSASNRMHYEMWPLGWVIGFNAQKMQMRLDRMYMITQLEFKVEDIRMVFDEPVVVCDDEKKEVMEKQKSSFVKDLLVQSYDLFGKDFRRKERNERKYLFPSDHFGILAKIVLSE